MWSLDLWACPPLTCDLHWGLSSDRLCSWSVPLSSTTTQPITGARTSFTPGNTQEVSRACAPLPDSNNISSIARESRDHTGNAFGTRWDAALALAASDWLSRVLGVVVSTYLSTPVCCLFSQDAKFVEERRKQLQTYLRNVMNKVIQVVPEFAASPQKETLVQLMPFFL